MKQDAFDRIVAAARVLQDELLRTKGADYSDGFDRLSNFKTNAMGLTDLQVWGVLAKKHWDAINAYVRNAGQLESEPITLRIADLANYLYLLLGLIEDRRVDR